MHAHTFAPMPICCTTPRPILQHRAPRARSTQPAAVTRPTRPIGCLRVAQRRGGALIRCWRLHVVAPVRGTLRPPLPRRRTALADHLPSPPNKVATDQCSVPRSTTWCIARVLSLLVCLFKTSAASAPPARPVPLRRLHRVLPGWARRMPTRTE